MITPTDSFRKVHYNLRPAKQVERRMLVDALLLLSEAGFQVRDYEYTGMGSIHFVDFVMFHKFLGIHSMISVELSSEIKDRIEFNRPYRNVIRTEVDCPIGDILAKLSQTEQHLVWLDYDNILAEYMLEDIAMAVSRMSSGSIFLITVDTELPGFCSGAVSETSPAETRAYFEKEAGRYLSPFLQDKDYRYENLFSINQTAIAGSIQTGLRGSGNRFLPLFNFLYKDGHRMMTIGGMLGGDKERRKIRRSRLSKTEYARFSLDEKPCEIWVPCLTRKELLYLDSYMPSDEGWSPKEFELKEDEIEQYKRIYRFFPNYAELLM